MKRLIYFITALLSAQLASAQTEVSSYYVSGEWTASGSPYTVTGSVIVPSGSTLIIDPGVEVIFQGHSSFGVYGTLRAQGTAAQPIVFHAADTTGFADLSTSNGGWAGIGFAWISSTTVDSSIMDHCKIMDVKLGNIGIGRPLTMSNTEITHCNNTNDLITVENLFGLITLTGCEVHHNYVTPSDYDAISQNIMYTSNLDGSTGLITNGQVMFDRNSFHDNVGNSMIYAHYSNMVVQNSEFYYNEMGDEGVLELSYVDSIIVFGNKIHHNRSHGLAAVHATCAICDITNNLICNNVNDKTGCGFVEGGGALHLSSNGDVGTTRYTVRNNIIVNNSSVQNGSAIYVFHTGPVITNNVIANNTCQVAGAAITFNNTWNTSIVKNNIFYNNQSWLFSDAQSIVSVSGGYYYFDNNIIPHTVSSEIEAYVALNLEGDTTGNQVGVDPQFISATTGVGDSIDATAANFNVHTSSPCINAGDSAMAQPYTTDYAGNARIAGWRIDIGAYECANCALGIENVPTAGNFDVYPNPSTGEINIQLPKAGGAITITDITGKQMMTMQANSQTVSADLSHFAKGIYILSWVNEGSAPSSKKITIE